MIQYEVVETFVSINGEGRKAGQLAFFLRLKGCNLTCSYCDTGWANERNTPAEQMTKEQIADAIRESGIRNVTITGGEPLLAAGMEELLQYLTDQPGLCVEVETNGSVDLMPYKNRPAHLSMTMDYKLPGSGMEAYMHLPNLALLTEWDTVKFVVSDKRDLEKAKEIIDQHALREHCSVYISPVFGRIHPEEIVEYLIEHSLNQVNLQLQLHKIIWDPNQRGV